MEFNYSFNLSTESKNYQFDVVSKNKNLLSGYKIVPHDEADLPAIQKFFKDAQVDESLTIEGLVNRLKVLPNISQVDVKVINIFSAHIQPHSDNIGARNIKMSKLIYMVKNISSDADVKALCRECLAQNNNNRELALDTLRAAFARAGVGTLSTRISSMLRKEASDKNVDEIKAFGRERTVYVTQFLKSLPQTANGAIDLTKMKKIDQGGTHDIFVVKDAPSSAFVVKDDPSSRFVIKVNRASLKMTSDERSEKFKINNAAYKALHDSFGDHCTVEQLLLRNVANDSGTKEAIISVADFEVGFQKKSKLDLQDTGFNVSDIAVARHLDAYDDMLKSLFFSENAPAFVQSTLEAMNPKIAKMANLIGQDPAFKAALKEFLLEFKEYFNKTGQYLDIAGKENIIFFRSGEGWTFKLGTVIKEETATKFGDCLNWLQNGAKKEEAPKNHISILRYCFHWTKTLNALALMVEMNDRIIDDANVKHVVAVWNELEATGVTGKPEDPKRLLEIFQVVEAFAADELLGKFKVLGVNPEKDADILLSILFNSPPDKKMVLAQYLHQELPKVNSGQGANYRFCYVRHEIGMGIRKLPEGKALALECFDEVLLDPSPNAPHAEVRQAIEELL